MPNVWKDRASMQRTVQVAVGEFSSSALLARHGGVSADLPSLFRQAVYYYLSDSNSGRPGWRYPRFRCTSADGELADVPLDIDDQVWSSFERKAEVQGVVIEQLLLHAALFYLADLDAGRVTERILEDFD